LGFGYLSWIHTHRLLEQAGVDHDGIEVIAEVIQSKIIEVKHRSSQAHGVFFYPKTDYFCDITVRYRVMELLEPATRQFTLEDDTICREHDVGDQIAGRYLEATPHVFVLDRGRLSWGWLVVTLSLFLLLAVCPILLVVRGLMRRRQPT
jgi:hypothetical protein